MRGSGAPAPSSSAELRRDMQLAPDAWLAHIRHLLRQGRRQQAIESLRLFRNAHPQLSIVRGSASAARVVHALAEHARYTAHR